MVVVVGAGAFGSVDYIRVPWFLDNDVDEADDNLASGPQSLYARAHKMTETELKQQLVQMRPVILEHLHATFNQRRRGGPTLPGGGAGTRGRLVVFVVGDLANPLSRLLLEELPLDLTAFIHWKLGLHPALVRCALGGGALPQDRNRCGGHDCQPLHSLLSLSLFSPACALSCASRLCRSCCCRVRSPVGRMRLCGHSFLAGMERQYFNAEERLARTPPHVRAWRYNDFDTCLLGECEDRFKGKSISRSLVAAYARTHARSTEILCLLPSCGLAYVQK